MIGAIFSVLLQLMPFLTMYGVYKMFVTASMNIGKDIAKSPVGIAIFCLFIGLNLFAFLPKKLIKRRDLSIFMLLFSIMCFGFVAYNKKEVYKLFTKNYVEAKKPTAKAIVEEWGYDYLNEASRVRCLNDLIIHNNLEYAEIVLDDLDTNVLNDHKGTVTTCLREKKYDFLKKVLARPALKIWKREVPQTTYFGGELFKYFHQGFRVFWGKKPIEYALESGNEEGVRIIYEALKSRDVTIHPHEKAEIMKILNKKTINN